MKSRVREKKEVVRGVGDVKSAPHVTNGKTGEREGDDENGGNDVRK